MSATSARCFQQCVCDIDVCKCNSHQKLFSEQRKFADEFVIVRVVLSCQDNDGDEDD